MPVKQADHVDGDTAQTEAAAQADPNMFVVRLKTQHADYIRRRAAAHGETPEQHINRIVMQFWAHHDEWRRQQLPGGARPGTAPVGG